jgi:hypothetical protein
MSLRLRQAVPGQPNAGVNQSTGVISADGHGYVVSLRAVLC